MKKNIILLASFILLASCGRELPDLWEPDPYVNGDVLAVEALDVDKIRVRFSVEVDSATAEVIANYSLLETNLIFSYAEMDRTNNRIVYIYCSNDMNAGTNYNLIANGVKDKKGYDINVTTNRFNSYGSDDFAAPEITITEPVADQLLGKSFLVYGSAHDDSCIDHIEIKVDGGDWDTAEGKETWTYLLDTSLYNETYQHTLYAKAVDFAGNAVISTVMVSIDRTDPVLTLTAPSADGRKVVNSGATIAFTGTASDGNNISYIAIILTNMYTNYTFTAIPTGVSNWKFDYTKTTSPLDESTNVFTIIAIDTAGNRTSLTRKLIVYRDNAVCVRTNGNVNGDGTAWFPMPTIIDGINKSSSLGYSTIKIAEGNYTFGTFTATSTGRSLWGGYSQDFTTVQTNFTTRTYITGTSLVVYNYSCLRNLAINIPITFGYYYPSTTYISNCIISNAFSYTQSSSMSGCGISVWGNKICGTGLFFQNNSSYDGFTLDFRNNIVTKIPTAYLINIYDSYYNSYINTFNCYNNLFINQTSGASIIYLYSAAASGGYNCSVSAIISGNTFSNYNINPITCYGYISSGASSSIVTATIKENYFYGNAAKTIDIENTYSSGSYYPSVTVTVESNHFNGSGSQAIYINRTVSSGTLDVRINRNWFTNRMNYYIYEASTYADPTYIVSNKMAAPVLAGYYYLRDENSSDITTIAALNALSANYFGNTNY